ncbi:chorismate synthase [Sesbania bispinosa]|nr:chorismate synthase [Sesbania bispinosa]
MPLPIRNSLSPWVELRKARDNLALRTAEPESAKKEVEDLRAEKEQAGKSGSESVGMEKEAVTTFIRKNLAQHQAKWDDWLAE